MDEPCVTLISDPFLIPLPGEAAVSLSGLTGKCSIVESSEKGDVKLPSLDHLGLEAERG